MPITAKFVPDAIALDSSGETAMSLQIHNGDAEQQLVQLAPAGDLAEHVRLASTSLTLEPGETFDMPVVIDISPSLAAGRHHPTVELSSGSGAEVAAAAVDVREHADHTVELRPEASHGASSGRHIVRVTNTGNVPVTVEILPDHLDSEIGLDVASPVVVNSGDHAEIPLRATPTTKFWSGPSKEHPFLLRTSGTDGHTFELVGVYEQRPRVAHWIGPAAAGALAALLIGTIVWLAWLKPWVQDTADEAAADAIALDRAALQERIDELEAAAAEAEELPLGTPTDLRLAADPAAGNAATDSSSVDDDMTLSITDVVFQNPSGAVGTVTLLRDDDVLLESELANFRDLDLHFVAPFTIEGGSDITLSVDCRTPGPGTDACAVGASLVGFIDEAG